MTIETRTLTTPALDLATFASTLTARASHPQALGALATDAAGGHPRQRAVIDRNAGGTFHVMLVRGVARWLLVRLATGVKGSWTTGERVDLDVSLSDGTTTITSSDSRIPAGLKGDTAEPAPLPPAGARLTPLGARAWVLDLAAFESGGTTLSGDRWTLSIDVAVTGTHTWCELVTVEELPRWIVDDTDDYGVLGSLYLARGAILDGPAQRLWDTARYAYSGGIRTYHQLLRDEADPWSIVAGSLAPWPGDIESVGVSRKYVARARTMRGTTDPRIAFRVRYRAVGASPGDVGKVSLTTGASNYLLTLTDTSGAWVEAEGTGYLDAATPEQQISWDGYRTGSGTWEICARTVFDDPA